MSASTSRPLSQTLRRSILLLSFATFSSMSAQRICDAMLPELSRVFGVGLAQAAQVVSVFAIVYGVLQLFYGPLGDRLGKFRVIAWATLACSLGNVLAALAPSLGVLLLARVMVAMAAAAIIPLSLAWIGDVADPAQLQETIARVGLGTTLGVGSGQLLGGLMADTLGWRWAFGLLAALFFGAGLLLLGDLRRQQALAPVAAPKSAARSHFLGQVLRILRTQRARTVLGVGVVEGAAGFGALALWATHLHLSLGFSLAAAGAVVALFGLGGVVYMTVARHLIRRLGPADLARLGVGLVALAALVIGLVPWRWPMAPASLCAGFGFFAFHNVMQAQAAQMAPDARGSAVSLFAGSLFLGQSLGVMAAAALAQRLGAGPVIVLGGAMLCVTGNWFAAALRRQAAP